ncbi:head fiber protein [Arthrobacter phage Lilmac1015]|uniref:Head fiber protein n=2 Tax=Lilmacvirus TaxID=3425005 RepID=A0AAE8XJT0_9CAUD|nr:head fiber protein [Arthrobacter phage Klevey]UKH48294.1 head fiber protein [Arthrobacter phage Lilmac1015]
MYGNADQLFEYFSDSSAITCKAGAAVTGKRFVKLAAGSTAQEPIVVPCGAGERPYGVAAWTVANGEHVTVVRRGVVSVTAGAALTVPLAIASDASGRAVAVGASPAVAYGDLHGDAAINTDAAVALSF